MFNNQNLIRKKTLFLSVGILCSVGFLIVGCQPQNVSSSSSSSSSSICDPINAGDFQINLNKGLLIKGAKATLTSELEDQTVTYEVTENPGLIEIDGNIVTAKKSGTAVIVGRSESKVSNEIQIVVVDNEEDPYDNVTSEQFYADYEMSTSLADSYFRTQHGYMSGSLEEQDQKPTIAENRPMTGDKYVRNSAFNYYYSPDVYAIVDQSGSVVNTIYKNGGYTSLEEVAAYVYAFGNIPANYKEGKNAKPSQSEWGKYLRLNHSYFSGDTKKYPYEPEFPSVYVNGGDLKYYEIDIGTTGTDSDPGYAVSTYNDGKLINRGAARIVYARYLNNEEISDLNERYVFYTYNHYNDFNEYLNYANGWGQMFGNITGGGTLSSKTDYNPTPYVAVSYQKIQICLSPATLWWMEKARNYSAPTI